MSRTGEYKTYRCFECGFGKQYRPRNHPRKCPNCGGKMMRSSAGHYIVPTQCPTCERKFCCKPHYLAHARAAHPDKLTWQEKLSWWPDHSDMFGDDLGPDCPSCGPVDWPCGDHFHSGVKLLAYHRPEEWADWDGPESFVADNGDTIYIVECPKCKKHWKLSSELADYAPTA